VRFLDLAKPPRFSARAIRALLICYDPPE